MFTGIVETVGIVTDIQTHGSNKTFWIESPISKDLKIDQSISHDGVCLTVEEVYNNKHRVTAILETLLKSTLGNWKTGNAINLEQCMKPGDRLDGHFVQGHVDTTATCIQKKSMDGSWQFQFRFPKAFASLLIEKGSISINGISLTVFGLNEETFSVAIIPYTMEHTNMQFVSEGDQVNLEFDMIGKYVIRNIEIRNKQ